MTLKWERERGGDVEADSAMGELSIPPLLSPLGSPFLYAQYLLHLLRERCVEIRLLAAVILCFYWDSFVM